jgi:hypothetical protein
VLLLCEVVVLALSVYMAGDVLTAPATSPASTLSDANAPPPLTTTTRVMWSASVTRTVLCALHVAARFTWWVLTLAHRLRSISTRDDAVRHRVMNAASDQGAGRVDAPVLPSWYTSLWTASSASRGSESGASSNVI